MTDGPPRKAWIDDPPRPSNKTPGQWHRECREREAEEAQELAAIRREAAEQTKAEIKAMLARAAKLGTSAYNVTVALLGSDLSMDEIIEACKKVPSEDSESVHRARPGAITAAPEPRLARPEEETWLKQAREHAESEWSKAMGKPMPVRQLSAEDIALNQSFNAIAAQAAGLVRDPDSGQKIFRSDRPDQEDERLFLAGEASARKIWPGR